MKEREGKRVSERGGEKEIEREAKRGRFGGDSERGRDGESKRER